MIVVKTEIRMALAECVVNFRQTRAQAARAIPAKPETHRVEAIAHHARQSQKLHLAIGFNKMPIVQHLVQVGNRRAASTALIRGIDAENPGTIEAEQSDPPFVGQKRHWNKTI